MESPLLRGSLAQLAYQLKEARASLAVFLIEEEGGRSLLTELGA